jgi:hypothetical protein
MGAEARSTATGSIQVISVNRAKSLSALTMSRPNSMHAAARTASLMRFPLRGCVRHEPARMLACPEPGAGVQTGSGRVGSEPALDHDPGHGGLEGLSGCARVGGDAQERGG